MVYTPLVPSQPHYNISEIFPSVDGSTTWCIGFHKIQGQDITILDKIVVYDLAGQRIGWVEYNCSESVNVVEATNTCRTHAQAPLNRRGRKRKNSGSLLDEPAPKRARYTEERPLRLGRRQIVSLGGLGFSTLSLSDDED